jgi:L-lactate dehydrogenase complex protein LldF
LTLDKDFLKTPGESGREATQAVRAATHRALAAREKIVRDYPRWEEWRKAARALKAAAMGRLDELLARLAREVEAWGGEVLWAADADQACRLILEVARRHRVQAVVKAKSMTTEEIGLNQALGAAGIPVTETDLGEFIIQLAGHRPSHLTAPALHLNRHQIARIFAAHWHCDCPPDPEALSRLASRHLQSHYARADMGITGVNFAAAAEGALVFLENESNLRQTASIPPVHLAVMGLEKVVADLGDLEVFLRLLPASATGQRLTALVHFLRGLKSEPRGRQAFYLVILDNGRRRLARDPELAEALYCLRCGACLNICPVFQMGGAHLYQRVYPGAIGILLAPFLAPVGDIADLCSQCGACQDICPAAIRLPEKILYLRRQSHHYRWLRTLSGLAGHVLSRPRLYRPAEAGLRLLPKLMPSPLGPELLGSLAPASFHRLAGGRGKRRGDAKADMTDPSSIPPFPGPPSTCSGTSPELRAATGEADGAGVSPELPSSLQSSATRTLFKIRLQEASSTLHLVRGPTALARLLAARAGEPLWLEDHPWLRRAAAHLSEFGLTPHFGNDPAAPPADTAVTVALGAIPETGSVLVGPASSAWPALQARKHIVLVPAAQAGLSLAEALALTRSQPPGLVTWLTGPTRTADIEKILVLGAQGPGEMEVVIYQGRPSQTPSAGRPPHRGTAPGPGPGNDETQC